MTQIIIVGGVSYNTMVYLDTLPEPHSQTLFPCGFHETIGATGAGKALNLRKLGYNIVLHAPIGDDTYGQAIIDYFAQNDVPFLFDIDPAGTQRHLNVMDSSGQRLSIFLNPGTFDLNFDEERLEGFIAESEQVILNINNYCRRLIPTLQRYRKPIWCDIHDYDGAKPYHQDFIRAADYLFLSSEALPNYRGFMEQMIAQGKHLVICTHGAQGSTALSARGEWIETPIIDTYILRDSNGAGDAFFSGVFYGHLQGYTPQQCLRLGTLVGGLCITSNELASEQMSRPFIEAEYHRVYGETLSSAE